MARTIDSARRVISGTWGELWIDGEKVAEVSACQAKVALNKETVNLCGRFMTTHKAMNASGTGSLTMHKVDSGFAQRMEGIKRGVDRRFTVISKLRDPDSYGAERVALYDVGGRRHRAGAGVLPVPQASLDTGDVLRHGPGRPGPDSGVRPP